MQELFTNGKSGATGRNTTCRQIYGFCLLLTAGVPDHHKCSCWRDESVPTGTGRRLPEFVLPQRAQMRASTTPCSRVSTLDPLRQRVAVVNRHHTNVLTNPFPMLVIAPTLKLEGAEPRCYIKSRKQETKYQRKLRPAVCMLRMSAKARLDLVAWVVAKQMTDGQPCSACNTLHLLAALLNLSTLIGVASSACLTVDSLCCPPWRATPPPGQPTLQRPASRQLPPQLRCRSSAPPCPAQSRCARKRRRRARDIPAPNKGML